MPSNCLGNPRKDDQAYYIAKTGWNKKHDKIIVSFHDWEAASSKRGVLRKLSSIYDHLGLVSPVTLVGKCLYRTVCGVKLAWDAELTGRLKLGWEQGLPKQIDVSRALADRREPIQEIKSRGFGDASGAGIGAVVNAVVKQELGRDYPAACSSQSQAF